MSAADGWSHSDWLDPDRQTHVLRILQIEMKNERGGDGSTSTIHSVSAI